MVLYIRVIPATLMYIYIRDYMYILHVHMCTYDTLLPNFCHTHSISWDVHIRQFIVICSVALTSQSVCMQWNGGVIIIGGDEVESNMASFELNRRSWGWISFLWFSFLRTWAAITTTLIQWLFQLQLRPSSSSSLLESVYVPPLASPAIQPLRDSTNPGLFFLSFLWTAWPFFSGLRLISVSRLGRTKKL